MKPYPLATLLALLTLTAASRLAAVEGIGNLSQIMPYGGIGDIAGIPPGGAMSTTFRTGSDNDPLNFVELEFLGLDDVVLSQVQVQLYKLPFPPEPIPPLVCDFTGPSIDPTPTQWPGDTTLVKFFPATSATLEPNTYYWLTVKMPPESPEWAALLFVNWTFDHTGLCDWNLGPFTWTGYFDGLQWIWDGQYGAPMKFKVDVELGSGSRPVATNRPTARRPAQPWARSGLPMDAWCR